MVNKCKVGRLGTRAVRLRVNIIEVGKKGLMDSETSLTVLPDPPIIPEPGETTPLQSNSLILAVFGLIN